LSTLRIETPRAFIPLLADNRRFRAAYGGRGGAKSHFFAELLIERCIAGPTRAVCIREVQRSLKESVRQLVIDKIQKFGAYDQFDIIDEEIRCPHGGLIIFRGMQSYNAESIKSLEGYDIAWVEEAQTLSERSLKMLRPTIRNEGSEIWFSWNPRHDTDPVDKFFRGASPPPRAAIARVNWNNNPWFPAELQEEMEHDRVVDPENAAHVWDGGYEIISEGSYYARLVAQAESTGRIGLFAHDPSLPVQTAWDIGVDDYTAIWFLQQNGPQVRAIDYYEASGVGPEQIFKEMLPELLKDEAETKAALQLLGRHVPYRYRSHFFPHDAAVREWGAGGRERVRTLVELGMPVETICVGVQADPADRVAAVRRLMPYMHFNQGPDPEASVNLGLSRLRKYRRRFNDSLQVYVGPLHDENSHGADAFGEFAVNCPLSRIKEPAKPKNVPPPPGHVLLPGPPEPMRGVKIRI
jgi:phage terminase large subunit